MLKQLSAALLTVAGAVEFVRESLDRWRRQAKEHRPGVLEPSRGGPSDGRGGPLGGGIDVDIQTLRVPLWVPTGTHATRPVEMRGHSASAPWAITCCPSSRLQYASLRYSSRQDHSLRVSWASSYSRVIPIAPCA